MRQSVRKGVFGALGVVLLCLPATAWAVPLDDSTIVADTTLVQTPAIEAPRLSRDRATIDKELLVSVGHDTVVLEPSAPYEILLDDTSLGVFNSDSNGQLFVQVKLPSNTQPGSHYLIVRNAQIELTKSITLVPPLSDMPLLR